VGVTKRIRKRSNEKNKYKRGQKGINYYLWVWGGEFLYIATKEAPSKENNGRKKKIKEYFITERVLKNANGDKEG